MNLELALKTMGLTNRDFTYMQLTQTFLKLSKQIEDEEELEELSEAYDFLKRNFKKLKTAAQQIDEN